jgi:hypothetical protein
VENTEVKYNWQPAGVFAGLALLIMAPLLKPGFVFALDMVPTPVWRLPEQVTSSYLFYALMHGLNFVIPADVLQKLLLLGIFLAAGLGMYGLARQLQKPGLAVINQELGAYFSGVFYVINPYTYSRFMGGQFAVLLGYALLPWFAKVLLRFLQKPTLRGAAAVGLLAAIMGVVSIHSLGLAFLFAVIALGLTVWKARKNVPVLRRLAGLTALSGGVFALLSSYWLVPVLLGRSVTASAISGFGVGDQQAFATVGSNTLERLANVGRLEGFWVEGQGLYRLPQAIGPVWWLALAAVFCLVIMGAIRYWRTGRRFETALFGLSALAAAFLAAGVFNLWFSRHVPFFAGYREPHKFAGLVALTYALFAGSGVAAALTWCQRRSRLILAAVAAFTILPFVFTPSMLLGGGKQLAARQYPAGWFTVNRLLNRDTGQFKVLFLPWHQYMHVSFAATIMANPAENFFDKPTLVNNDPEFGRSTTNRPDAVKTFIGQKVLPAAPYRTDLGARLAKLNIRYVVLAGESDSDTYRYLDRQKDLRLVFSDGTMKLYKNLTDEQVR